MKLIENLKELGFNTYEAKVYIALLKKYPATGYEVSQVADIPQSRAYDTLKSLLNEQIITADNSKPIKYTPIKPSDLLKRYKKKINTTFDFLEKNLPSVKEDYTEPILSVKGIDNIKEKIIDMIKSSKKELYIEIWSNEFNYFEPYLLDAYNRGVDIKIVGYDNLKSNFGMVFEHKGAGDIENYFDGKVIFVVSDEKEGLLGTINYTKTSTMSVIWTKNQGIVLLIKEFIIHDIYLIDIEKNLSNQLDSVYGKNLKMLKDVLFGSGVRLKFH